jgi:hypothetical protein
MEPDPGDDAEEPPRSDAGVLSPQDLEPDEDYSVEIQDGRYVVSSEGKPEVDPDSVEESLEDTQESAGGGGSDGIPDGKYSYRVTLSVENTKLEKSGGHDDVSDGFEDFVTAYVDLVSDDTPSEEVLGVLLASSLDVKVPAPAFKRALRRHGVSPEDSVEELFDAVREQGGFYLESE